MSGLANPLEVLGLGDVLVGCTADSMSDAIELVGGCLVERGAVSSEYVSGMHAREEVMTTYLGNGIALPHGVLESKQYIERTAIVVAQFPAGVDWVHGTAHLVVGLAAVGEDHIAVLAQLAEVLQDEDLCQHLATVDDPAVIHDHLTAASDEEDDD